MIFQFEFHKLHWWYWTVSWVLVVAGLAGFSWAFLAVTALAALQIFHYGFIHRSLSAFPVQVRVTVFFIFLAGLAVPVIYWIPAFGLFVRISVNYCLTARILKLFPWNRPGVSLTGAYFRKTIFSPPTHGPLS